MNAGMIKQLQKLQKEMMDTENELNQTTFYGSSGGIVQVEVLGTKEVSNITIKEHVEDMEMLADMIQIAINQANNLVDVTRTERMSKFEKNMKGFGF